MGPLIPDSDKMKRFREECCAVCPFNNGGHTPEVYGEGGDPSEVKMVFVGEAPGQQEQKHGRPFIGAAGMLLRAILTRRNLSARNVYITNVCKCRPPGNKTPTRKEFSVCLPLLQWELRHFTEFKVPIVALGKTAMNAVVGTNNAITPNRGSVRLSKFGLVMPTFHPAAVSRDPNKKKYLVEDVARAADMYRPPAEEPTVARFIGKGALTKLKKTAKSAEGTLRLIVDIETKGGHGKKTKLTPFLNDSRITVVGIKVHSVQESYHFTDTASIKRACQWIEAQATKRTVALIGHNFKFDLLWLTVLGVMDIDNVFNFRYWDTKINYAMMDEEAPNKGLKHLCTALFNLPDSTQDWDKEIPIDKLIEYNSGDLIRTELLYDWEVERTKLIPWKLAEYSTPVLVYMEYQGIEINMKELQDYLVKQTLEVKYAYGNLSSVIEKPGSNKELCKRLYKDWGLPALDVTPTGAASVGKDTLTKLMAYDIKDEYKDFIKTLLHWRKQAKILSTYIKPFFTYLSEQHNTHKTTLHPFYEAAKHEYGGTVTGRLSSRNPNFQNIPHDINVVFGTRFKGGHLWSIDLSQIELRVLAELSQDPELMDIFKRGGDLHELVRKSVVAPRVAHMHLNGERERRLAKDINFGIAYGISAYGLMDKLPGLSETDARALIKRWFEKFSGVKLWHRDIEDEVIANGVVYNMFGRPRHLIGASQKTQSGRGILRQAKNFPVQSTASDITVYGIEAHMIENILVVGFKSIICGNVHDSVYVDVYPGEEEIIRGLVVDAFGDPYLPPVGLGSRWSDVSEVPIGYEIKEGETNE